MQQDPISTLPMFERYWKDDDFKKSFRSSLKNTTFHAKYYHKLTQHGSFNLEDETFSLQRNLELRVPFPYVNPADPCYNGCCDDPSKGENGMCENILPSSSDSDEMVEHTFKAIYRDIEGDGIKNYSWFNGKEATLIKSE